MNQIQLVFKPAASQRMMNLPFSKRWSNQAKPQPYYIGQQWPENLASEQALLERERDTNRVLKQLPSKPKAPTVRAGRIEKNEDVEEQKEFAFTPTDEGFYDNITDFSGEFTFVKDFFCFIIHTSFINLWIKTYIFKLWAKIIKKY